MNELTAERGNICAELELVGVPATTDPGEVLTLLTQAPAAVLVLPVVKGHQSMGRAALDLQVPVLILTRGPSDNAAEERLDEALLLALPVLDPADGWDPGSWDGADTYMPARSLVTTRRITYPITVHP